MATVQVLQKYLLQISILHSLQKTSRNLHFLHLSSHDYSHICGLHLPGACSSLLIIRPDAILSFIFHSNTHNCPFKCGAKEKLAHRP